MGNFKAAIELTGYADNYYIYNNEFIGDNSNIGIRYKTITLRDSFIKRNKFRNLSKCFSINTLSMLALPNYDTRVEGTVTIEDNTYLDSTTAYEIFAVADIEGIETFTMTCQNNNFYNISKYTNIQTILTNFHLNMFDKIDLSKSTFNGNTLYERQSSVSTSINRDNVLPYNFTLTGSNGNVLGFTTRSIINTGVTTDLTTDENDKLVINTGSGVMTSYTYAQLLYVNNPLIDYNQVTMYTKFTCESNVHFYMILQVVNNNDNVVKQVTLIDQEMASGEIYEKYNIFNLSTYEFNNPNYSFRIIFQFGLGSNYSPVNNFKLLDMSIVEGINYKTKVNHKKYSLNDITELIKLPVYYASTYPLSGTFRKGTRIYNNNPKIGSYNGWVYDGSQWLGFGKIE